MTARTDLADAVHFIFRVSSRGRSALTERDFDLMTALFMDRLDAYLTTLRPTDAGTAGAGDVK